MPSLAVISLSRTPERRTRFADANPGLDYRFFDAVDGAALSPQELAAGGVFAPGLNYSVGAKGCALSHRALWLRAIEGREVLTIAEDDTIFRADFVMRQRECIERLPRDWDVVVWGWNFDAMLALNAMPDVSPAVVLFSQDQMRMSLERFRAAQSDVHPFALTVCFGTPAYTVSPAGAQRLLQACFPLRDFRAHIPALNLTLANVGIDCAMAAAYGSLKAFACFPPLVVTPNIKAGSTVQSS